ncbi:MAG: adenylate/guanylate cyclase domain-containing protein [Ferrovibrio sp.]
MDLTYTRRRRLSLLYTFMGLGILLGAGYGTGIAVVLDGFLGAHTLLHGTLRGAFTGLLVSTTIASFELYAVEGAHGLRRQPFLKLLAIKEAVYIGAILCGDWIGSSLFGAPGDPGFGFNRLTAVTFFFSVGFALLINFVMEMSMLLGPGVLGNMLRGRYHRPRTERRLMVFFDMRGSTAIAEKIGDLAFHNLLNRFFVDLTEAVLAWGGVIHKYVGDEMIVTWSLDGNGRNPGGAFAAAREAHRRLAQLADRYHRDFNVAPQFRAVLHAGPVVAGEMGEVKREIVLLGDTVNTTAKIEVVAKSLTGDIIASADALAAAELPDGMTSRLLGTFPLPGKTAPVALYSIT